VAPWIAALLIGFVAVGLTTRYPARLQHWLVVGIIMVVLAYEAVSIHAF
jgi:hypothetical protein